MKEAKNKIILNGKWYRWNDFYAVAEKLFAETGSINVSVKFLYNDLPIGRWLSRQRNRKQKGQLKDWQIVKLESLNFLWSQTELCKEKKKSEWFDKFELAKNYYKEHGDLFIPRSYIVDGFDLGNWLSNITSAYLGQSHRRLFDYQIDALNSLFPDWYKNQPQVVWDKMYNLACEYYNKYGNIRLSQADKYNGVKLGSWLHHQKCRYRKGELPQERIDLLEKLDIWWNPTFDRWYKNYNEAKKYYQQFGSLDIPNDYISNGITVGRWIAVQREAHNGRKDTRLTDWQKRMLDEIGMIWETKRVGNSTSFNEQTVLYYASIVYPGTISRYKLNGYELDIYIPEIRTAIEYDGVYWHKDKQERDLEKPRICRKNNFSLEFR